MSDKVICTKSKITAIANKIRYKLSSQDTYTLDEMPAAIESIGGSAVLNQLSVTQNGTYTPPSGTDGYDEVIVNVPAILPEIFNIDLTTQKYPSIGYGEKYGRKVNFGYTSNNWDGEGMWSSSTYSSNYEKITDIWFIDDSTNQYKYTITLVLGTMWDDTLTSGDPPTSKACYYIQHWGNRQVTGLGYHNTASDGGNWRITYNSDTNNSVQILDLPLTDIHDLDDETIVITYIPSTGKATYTIKNVDYQVDVRRNVNNYPPNLGIGGYDNTALCYCRYKSITVVKEILTA